MHAPQDLGQRAGEEWRLGDARDGHPCLDVCRQTSGPGSSAFGRVLVEGDVRIMPLADCPPTEALSSAKARPASK